MPARFGSITLLALGLALAGLPSGVSAQGTENGEWRS